MDTAEIRRPCKESFLLKMKKSVKLKIFDLGLAAKLFFLVQPNCN